MVAYSASNASSHSSFSLVFSPYFVTEKSSALLVIFFGGEVSPVPSRRCRFCPFTHGIRGNKRPRAHFAGSRRDMTAIQIPERIETRTALGQSQGLSAPFQCSMHLSGNKRRNFRLTYAAKSREFDRAALSRQPREHKSARPPTSQKW